MSKAVVVIAREVRGELMSRADVTQLESRTGVQGGGYIARDKYWCL